MALLRCTYCDRALKPAEREPAPEAVAQLDGYANAVVCATPVASDPTHLLTCRMTGLADAERDWLNSVTPRHGRLPSCSKTKRARLKTTVRLRQRLVDATARELATPSLTADEVKAIARP